MEALKLNWLGHPLVEWKGQAIKLETRKAAALLAYLSLTPGECQREVLATMFWQEGNQQKALANLRRALSFLNTNLSGWIEADRETISLKRNIKLWVDVDAFHQSLSQLKEHPHPENETCDDCLSALNKTVELYRGDFLEGLNLSDSPIFDEWQFFQRDGLRQEFADVLQRLSSGHSERGQWDQAIVCARRWLALDRLHEPACRALMDLYARSGQRTAALRQYEELERLLDEQMSQEPEPETRRLYEQILGRGEAKQLSLLDAHTSSFPLLKTKLYIPTTPASKVERSHLIERLGKVEKKALTIVSAPAGFGKTTLLAEWIARTSLPVAWLSLDNGDNDPYRFLSYLIAALESIHENVGLEARQIMQSPQLAPPHIILASLINDLATVTEPYVLVLDDYQFISEQAVHGAVGYLLDHIPSNLHIVIATRADPPLQLARLLAHNQMLELRTQDLRFTLEEAMQFMNTVMMLGLSEDNLRALEEKTEGWIVGLQMAALSLKDREERDDFIHAFSGSNRYVMDYLLDEVLARQEAYVEYFLIATSNLDKLCGPLCDAVLDHEWTGNQRLSGQEILEYLEAANMFVVPLDDKRLWYRYHHLFADLLRTRAGRYSSDQISKFRIRASVWCEEQGFTLDAIKYALDGKDYSRAAALIDGISKHFISPIDFGELQSYITHIPADIIRQHPWTCLAQTHLWVTLGKIDKVEEWLDWVAARIETDHEDEGVSATIALHRAYVKLFNRDLPKAVELGSVALQILHPSRLHLRCRLTLLVGESYLLQGLFEKSNIYLREAIELGKTIPDMFLLTTACFRLTLQLKLQGKLAEAEHVYQENIQLLKASKLESSHLMTKPQIGLGDIYRERGQLQMAESLLMAGTQRAEQLGFSYDLVYAYSLMAKLMQAQGKIEQALEFLDKNIALFQMSPTPEAIVQVTKNLRAGICLLHGRPDVYETWISSQSIDQNPRINFLNELDYTTYARSLISKHDYERAGKLLTQLAEVAEKDGRIERLIKVLVLQAIALYSSGKEDEAIGVLLKSLVLAEPEGYQRIFLDEGEIILALVKRLMASKIPPHIHDFLNHLPESNTSSAYVSV